MAAARASVSAPPPTEPDTQLDPALVRLSQHTQAIDENPDSFDPKVTLRNIEQAFKAAKTAFSHEGTKPNQQELEAKALRYKELFAEHCNYVWNALRRLGVRHETWRT